MAVFTPLISLVNLVATAYSAASSDALFMRSPLASLLEALLSTAVAFFSAKAARLAPTFELILNVISNGHLS
jgi:hypothetical protein